MPTHRPSGNLLADRRFAYGAAAFAEDDHAAAADLAEQALELAPDYAPAHALLGRARACLGDRDGALAALRAAAALDRDDALGVGVDLARLGAAPVEAALSPAFVRALFDEYAPRFDRHLTEGLGYRGPALLRDAVERAACTAGRSCGFRRLLDLGCGTGLAGAAFADLAETLVGVDLSPAMLVEARRRGVYAELRAGDLAAFLADQPAASADLVLAADVFVYLGDLGPALAQAARVLAPGGLVAFTVQAHEGDGVLLGADDRYAHGETYLRAAASRAGLAPVLMEPASTRRDEGREVEGMVVVLAHPGRGRGDGRDG